MSQSKLDQIAHAQSEDTEDSRWRSLYRIGAVAALLSVIVIPISIVSFFIWPPFPDDILLVIQEDWLAGLLDSSSSGTILTSFSWRAVLPFRC